MSTFTMESPRPIIRQKRQKRLEGGEGKALPKLVPDLRKEDIFQHLRDLIGTICPTSADKFHLLRRRDDLLYKLRAANTESLTQRKFTKGTCPDMCPEKERYMRDVKRTIHSFECDQDGQIIPERMVKDYTRSAADQDAPLAHELRPLNVLRVTMDYLIHYMANEIPTSSTDLARWYDFLWTRTRAIRKDITQQMLDNELAVDLVEKCVRLHIFAAVRLVHLNMADFNQKINTENLSKSLQTLRHMYEDLSKKNIYCANEAEFRSYDIILNLSDHNVHSQVLNYRPKIRESPEVELALMLAVSLQNNNFVKFFRLVRHQATFLQACLCFRYFPMVRLAALRTISLAYQLYPVDRFVAVLAFDSEAEALAFLDLHDVELDPTDPSFINVRDARATLGFTGGGADPMAGLNCDPVQQEKCDDWLVAKAGGFTLPQVLCNRPEEKSPYKVLAELPRPVDSFNARHEYVHDPVLSEFLDTSSCYRQKLLRDFSTNQTNLLIERAVGDQLRKIALSTHDRMWYLKEVEEQLERIRGNLAIISARKYAKRWLIKTREFTKVRQSRKSTNLFHENHKPNMFSQMKGTSFSTETVKSAIGKPSDFSQPAPSISITTKKQVDRQKLLEQRRSMIWEFMIVQGAAVLETCLTEQLKAITKVAYAEERKYIEDRLHKIRENLHKEWLRQFVHRWQKVVHRNRALYSFSLPVKSENPSTSSMSTSIFSNSSFRPYHRAPGESFKRLSAESIQLKLYLKQFRKARTDYLAKKYADKWFSFMDKAKLCRIYTEALYGPCFTENEDRKRRASYPVTLCYPKRQNLFDQSVGNFELSQQKNGLSFNYI